MNRNLHRRNLLSNAIAIVIVTTLATLTAVAQATDPLPSWNDGAAKQAIIHFVAQTTEKTSPDYVKPEERIATFDQDGTLWVEQPIPTQAIYCLDRVPALVAAKPELKNVEPYKTVLSGDRAAISRLSMKDLEQILMATLSGMTVDQFQAEVKDWLATAKDDRWHRSYTELTYQPMQELILYLRANGYKTYIVTGGGQDFVRVFSEQTYGIPPEQVVGSMGGVTFTRDADGKFVLIKDPKITLINDKAGKVQGIHMVIGRRPYAAFGNTPGDQQMLEYTKAGDGPRLAMLVLHDDAVREYAYGPARGLPAVKLGAFPQDYYDLAIKNGWVVISMKNDWNRVFSFPQ